MRKAFLTLKELVTHPYRFVRALAVRWGAHYELHVSRLG